jgi:hypothetical protein
MDVLLVVLVVARILPAPMPFFLMSFFVLLLFFLSWSRLIYSSVVFGKQKEEGRK